MAVVAVNQSAAFSAEVRNLLQALRIARSAAGNIQQLNGNMDAGQLPAIMGIDDQVITDAQWVSTINALVTLLDDTAVDNFTGRLVQRSTG